MAENTVEVDGVQFNAENLLAALEDVLDEPDGYGSSINGSVVVEDDGHTNDTDVNLTELDSCSIVTHKNAETLVEKCKEATEQPFEEIVTQHLVGVDEFHKGKKAVTFGFGYDCVVQSSLGFKTSQVQDFIQDDRIAVGQFAGKGDENTPTIGLNDAR